MLENHSDTVSTYFLAEHEPQIGFATKLSGAAEAVQAKLAVPHWAFGPGGYILRDPKSRFLLNLTFRQSSSQTLGLAIWQKRYSDYGSLFKIAFETMNVKTLKRLQFNLRAYLLLGMSHREMAELLFGSFLLPAKDLEPVCGKADDALVQLHGGHKNLKLRLIVAPMTVEQSTENFLATANLEHFIEPKLLDTGVKDFWDRLIAPCLYVDVDLSLTNCAVTDLPLFLKDSLEGAQNTCEQTVLRLMSLKSKKGH